LILKIEATRYLVDHLHIIDPRRIGVWGWSYGGYTTLRILSEEKQNLFQCGIAVAPVTNWRFYGKHLQHLASKLFPVYNVLE
jgi:dipeptidyl aminopeptidase/acylaminoacyl peptidase